MLFSDMRASNAITHVFVAVVVAVLIYLGISGDWVLCWTNCGETFDALLYVENFELYGLKYNLVQDMATGPNPEAHPFLYTHNPNIAGYLFVLLHALGFTSVAAKQAFTVGVFGVGLVYVGYTVRHHSGSAALALLSVALFCLDVEHVLSYGLNPLRAWHWLALFGLLYHVERLLQGGTRLHLCAVAILAAASLGIGYDFWVICGSISLLLTFIPAKAPSQQRLRCGVMITAMFLIPALIRQLQIALTIGPQLWLADLLVSLSIKVPFLSELITLPPIQQVDEQYKEWNLMRPPATPPTGAGELLRTLYDMTAAVVVPSYGAISGAVLVCVISWAAAFLMGRRDTKATSSSAAVFGKFSERYGAVDLHQFARLMLALTGGIALGLAFFAPVSFHIYIKHGFPLLAAPFHLAKAFFILAVGAALYGLVSRRLSHRYAALSALSFSALLILESAWVSARNVDHFRPISVAWMNDLKRLQGSTVAVSWIPNSASVFTKQWSVGIAPGRERDVLARLEQRRAPFDNHDLFLFGQHDASRRMQEYLQPRYWLYFPVDQNTQFDHPEPECRQDWLVGLVKGFVQKTEKVPSAEIHGIQRREQHDAIVLRLWGLFQRPPTSVLSVGLESQSSEEALPVAANAVTNCMYRSFEVFARIGKDAWSGMRQLRLVLHLRDGRTVKGPLLDLSAPGEMPSSYVLRLPQPTSEYVAATRPDNAAVAAEGPGYIILDLSAAYREGAQ